MVSWKVSQGCFLFAQRIQRDAAELNPNLSVYVTTHCKKDMVLQIVVDTRLFTRPGSDQPQSQGTCSCSMFEIGFDVVLIGAPAHQYPCAANRRSAGF